MSVPRNPYLADSSWPTFHGDSFATDGTASAGPSAGSAAGGGLAAQLLLWPQLATLENSMLPISLVASAGNEYLWGASRRRSLRAVD